MIGDGRTLLEILHQLPIKNFFGKAKLRQVPVTGSHTQKFDVNHVFSGHAFNV